MSRRGPALASDPWLEPIATELETLVEEASF